MKQTKIIHEADDKRNYDHEADMARSELYRLAEYSVKLFKMIEPGSNLEGWTASKITKAADYIGSVYHYMKYESKFGDDDQDVDRDEMDYDESIKKDLTNQLAEQWQQRKQG
jgi:hypothetical protein